MKHMGQDAGSVPSLRLSRKRRKHGEDSAWTGRRESSSFDGREKAVIIHETGEKQWGVAVCGECFYLVLSHLLMLLA